MAPQPEATPQRKDWFTDMSPSEFGRAYTSQTVADFDLMRPKRQVRRGRRVWCVVVPQHDGWRLTIRESPAQLFFCSAFDKEDRPPQCLL